MVPQFTSKHDGEIDTRYDISTIVGSSSDDQLPQPEGFRPKSDTLIVVVVERPAKRSSPCSWC